MNASYLNSKSNVFLLYGVDATKLHHSSRGLGCPAAANGFNVIAFPFPHTGFQPENVHENNWDHIARNKELVAAFLTSAVSQLHDGKEVRSVQRGAIVEE